MNEASSILAYVHAAIGQIDDDQREQAIAKVGKRLADHDDPIGQVRAIAKEFFSHPPLVDNVSDDTPLPGDAMSARPGRYRFMDPEPPIPSGHAKPVKGVGPLARHRDDGRKTVRDVEIAAKIVAEATYINALLGPIVYEISTKVREFRTGDLTTDAAIRRTADILAAAAKAAGSLMPPKLMRSDPLAQFKADLVADGAGVYELEQVQRFADEHDWLVKCGGTRMSKEHFVARQLDWWRTQNGN